MKPTTENKINSAASKQVPSKTARESKNSSIPAHVQPKCGSSAVSPNTAPPAETQGGDGVVIGFAPCNAITKSDLEPIESAVAGIDQMDIKAVEKEILKSCNQSEEQSLIAVNASKLKLAYGWKCGKLLNRAKALLKKGNFGNWRDSYLIETEVMSIKTTQRCMSLANHWDSLDALLTATPNLWTAYQECGILPATEETEVSKKSKAESETNEPDPVAKYVAAFTKLQQVMRMLTELKAKIPEGEPVSIPEDELNQFKLGLEEINRFANILFKMKP